MPATGADIRVVLDVATDRFLVALVEPGPERSTCVLTVFTDHAYDTRDAAAVACVLLETELGGKLRADGRPDLSAYETRIATVGA